MKKYDFANYVPRSMRRRAAVEKFFSGKLYAFLVTALVLIAHTTATELYIMPILCVAATVGFIICDSIRHFLPLLLTFIYMVNAKHSPGVPYWSDYYSSGLRLGIIIFFFVILGIGLLYYIIRRVIPRMKGRMPPMLIPILILSVSFMTNGLFYPEYTANNLIYGGAQVLVYFVLFYAVYYGLENEDTDAIISYFTYLGLLIAMVLLGEMAFIFLTYDGIFTPDGSIVKTMILTGWGVSNPLGFSLGILMPLLTLGAMRSKRFAPVYYLVFILCWAGATLTLSRNALLCAGTALLVCSILGCFIGRNKKMFRICACVIVGVAAIASLLFFNKITVLIQGLLNQGFNNNGRYFLWNLAIDFYKSAPIFGVGFYGFDDGTHVNVAKFLPVMAHNTVPQLLASMGLFGTAAYSFYRLATLRTFFKKMTVDKLMLFGIFLYFGVSSLLDNFVFYIYTAFLYVVALAIAQKILDNKEKEIKK